MVLDAQEGVEITHYFDLCWVKMAKNGPNLRTVGDFDMISLAKMWEIYWNLSRKKYLDEDS